MSRLIKATSLLFIFTIVMSACMHDKSEDNSPKQAKIVQTSMGVSQEEAADSEKKRTVFPPDTAEFFLNVQFEPNLKVDDIVKTQWWFKPSNFLINTTSITIEKDAKGIDFNLNTTEKPANWPEGLYETKIYHNGIHKGTVEFKVEAEKEA